MKFSLYFCYGPSAGFRIEWRKNIKRIVLWKVAFGIIHNDIEIALYAAVKEIKSLRQTVQDMIELNEKNCQIHMKSEKEWRDHVEYLVQEELKKRV